jgi:NAD-dependent dihydropyrimidine dehydrogenase PreA subunit
MVELSIRTILVAGRPVGIAGLDEALRELARNGRLNGDDAGSRLLELIEQNNFVPDDARGDYRQALEEEWLRSRGRSPSNGSRTSEVAPKREWRGRRREEIAWFPTVVEADCDGCADCLEFCAFGVFVLNEATRAIVVVEPYNCVVGCSACEKVCRRGAIRFPPRRILGSVAG